MTQRTLAGLLAVPLLVALWFQVLREPLPYVIYSPGLTVDVLGTTDADQEIIEVSGAETYDDDGQLRLTTVLVTQPQSDVNLFQLLGAWIDGDDAVYPYDAVYGPRGHRRVEGGGGRLPDGELAGQRDRRGADRAGLRRPSVAGRGAGDGGRAGRR